MKKNRMKSLTVLFEKVLPHLMIASAAVGVFMLMAVAIFFSILMENWYESRRQKHEFVYDQAKVKMSWAKRQVAGAPSFGKFRPSWQPLHAPAK